MKIKLSQHTSRKAKGTIIPKVSIITRIIKITLENICLESDVIHLTRKETMLENVLETKMSPTGRRETREDIMLTLHRMMNLPQKESDMKVMKNMF